MNKLKEYAGLLNQAAPENHFLAYITKDEKDMLVKAGGKETPTISGILAYPPLGEAGTSPGTTTSGESAYSGSGGNGGAGSQFTSGGNISPGTDVKGNIRNDNPYTGNNIKDDDIDSTYTTTSFDVTPEESSAGEFMNNITSAYEKVEVPIKFTNMIMSPDPFSFGLNMLSYTAAKNKQKAKQDAYIASLPSGEDEYGHGDYMEDVQDYSARVYDTDYSGLDQEGQAELDLE